MFARRLRVRGRRAAFGRCLRASRVALDWADMAIRPPSTPPAAPAREPQRGAVHFAPEETFRGAVSAAWEREAARLRSLVPGTDLQHVGSTAIPGSLTKGDLDIQVRVQAHAFAAAEAVLAGVYARNEGSDLVPGALASFVAKSGGMAVGIQLTSVDGPFDTFWRFREALLARADLRERYDALKRAFEGRPMAEYRHAKEAFLDEVRRTDEFANARLPDRPRE
jgi:GrpB-like predicted nucleotidyltransferase (UPF0157 family)